MFNLIAMTTYYDITKMLSIPLYKIKSTFYLTYKVFARTQVYTVAYI